MTKVVVCFASKLSHFLLSERARRGAPRMPQGSTHEGGYFLPACDCREWIGGRCPPRREAVAVAAPPTAGDRIGQRHRDCRRRLLSVLQANKSDAERE